MEAESRDTERIWWDRHLQFDPSLASIGGHVGGSTVCEEPCSIIPIGVEVHGDEELTRLDLRPSITLIT